MATLDVTLAKTRTQLWQQKFIDGTLGDYSPTVSNQLMYYAKTTDATATEMFIAGKGGAKAQDGTTYYNRLYIPESSIVFLEYTYLGYNSTDDTFAGLQRGFACVENLNGTTAASWDLNKSGSGNDTYVLFDTYNSDTTSGIDLAHLGSSGLASLVPTLDDTGDFIKFVVTGTSAKTIYHKVYCKVFSINETECKRGLYFGDTAAQSTGK
jgi:hypothetical protein